MKKLFLVSLLCLTTSAFAGWQSVAANCHLISGAVAKCVVRNYTGRSLSCNMTAGGVTARGFYMHGYANGFVPSGRTMYAYVRANNPQIDPLVNAYATAQCLF